LQNIWKILDAKKICSPFLIESDFQTSGKITAEKTLSSFFFLDWGIIGSYRLTRRNRNIRETNAQLELRILWAKWERQAQTQRRGLEDWKKMIEEGSLMLRHNGRSSLSSKSLVNQHRDYRLSILWRKEKSAAISYVSPINMSNSCHNDK